MAFNKDKAIIAQNSATAAATIIAAEGSWDPERFDTIREHIFDGSLRLADAEVVVEHVEGGSGEDTPRQERAVRSVPDSTGDVVVKMGKYRGDTIAAIFDKDPSYVEWMADKSTNDFLKSKASDFLASQAS